MVIGDGAEGWPAGAPFDRVIATAAVASIPPAWLQQTRTGGIILAPLADSVHPSSPLARLVVGEDGTAQGACLGEAPFMPLRNLSVAGSGDQTDQTEGDPDQLWHLAPDTPAG